MGERGSDSAIAVVKKQREKKGMRFVSSAATPGRDVDSGACAATVDTCAAGIQKITNRCRAVDGKGTGAVPADTLHPPRFHH